MLSTGVDCFYCLYKMDMRDCCISGISLEDMGQPHNMAEMTQVTNTSPTQNTGVLGKHLPRVGSSLWPVLALQK